MVKPTVDLGALNLRRIHGGGNGIDQIALEGLLAHHDVMVQPLYARADLVAGENGEPLLIELELIDPHLFLAERPGTAAALADAVLTRLRLP